MDIETTQYERVAVIKTEGRIDSNTSPDLRNEFERLTGDKRYRLVFDMGAVTFLSSSGAWVLLDTQKVCKKKGGDLVIANVNEDIQYTLELAGLKHFFQIYDDVTAAVGSL